MRRTRLPLLALLVIAGGCATSGSKYDPAPRRDIAEVRALLNYTGDRTRVGTERMGKPYYCFCADPDALQQLLGPDKY